VAFGGCTKKDVGEGFKGLTLKIVTTTSTENTGLLDEILPLFKNKYGCDVKVIAVGSGAAFEMATRQEADVIIVHAPEAEEAFMIEGFGRSRVPLMYNDYVIVGKYDILKEYIDEKNDLFDVLLAVHHYKLPLSSRLSQEEMIQAPIKKNFSFGSTLG
jgi:tungstate transport system substrate-binding protein